MVLTSLDSGGNKQTPHTSTDKYSNVDMNDRFTGLRI